MKLSSEQVYPKFWGFSVNSWCGAHVPMPQQTGTRKPLMHETWHSHLSTERDISKFMYCLFWHFLFSCGLTRDNPNPLVSKENTKTSRYNDWGYWARNHLPNCNHLNHSPDVARACLPHHTELCVAEKTSCHAWDRNSTAEALLETFY